MSAGVFIVIASVIVITLTLWASREYVDRRLALLENKLAQRMEQHVVDTDNRIDTLEEGVLVEFKTQTKELTNAVATTSRVRRQRNRLRDDIADLKSRQLAS